MTEKQTGHVASVTGNDGTGAGAALSGSKCSAKNRNCQPVHGAVHGRTWYKAVRKSRHMLRVPKPAWAVDFDDLGRAIGCGCTCLEVRELEEGKTYRVDLLRLITSGQRFNRGAGEQVSLPLGYWHISGQDSRPMGAQQLSFLAGVP